MQSGRNSLSLSDQQSAFDLYVYRCFCRYDRRDFAQFKQEVRVRNTSSAPQQSFPALLRTRKQARKMLIGLNFEAAMAKEMKTPSL